MKNRLIISDVLVEQYKIYYRFNVEGEWNQLFKLDKEFYVEYSEDISNVPKGIAVIPFLCNVIPIAWICDAEIIVSELDREFYNCINDFKQGYTEMYPMISFGGEILVGEIKDNAFTPEKRAATFFSGGVDSFFTLIARADEKPSLITIWGADIPIDDVEGWEKARQHVEATAEKFNVDHLFIKSSFRLFLDERKLDGRVAKSKVGWWYGFQHGIGIIGHVAPYAFINRLESVYMASSCTREEKGKVPCASDPTIDNFVRFCGCRVEHDGYDFSRQDKIHMICDFSKKNDMNISVRVCWESKGGGNCCSCEKCYRTIMGIIAQEYNPKEYGFEFDEKTKIRMIDDLRKRIIVDDLSLPLWADIQRTFNQNKTHIVDYMDYEWFSNVDINKFNATLWKKIGFIKLKLKQFLWRLKNGGK